MPALTFSPEFLAKYDQLQPLGEGGMGTVYRGIQRSLERPVAIKFLSRQLLDHEYLQRFTAEARLAGQVFHTNLVAVIEFGIEGDVPFIVFELVEGASLREHVKRAGGRVGLKEALDIVRQAAEGLAVAHGIGIVHRDIKPENILVGRDVVKVADFGVAKSSSRAEKTRSGVIMGTPAYLSPEQARELPITPASDIYALGVVLFELLGGALPFQKSSTLELLQAIVHEPPPSLEGVPPPIGALVSSMLAKEPQDRPVSMAACARELARIVGELDPEARIVPVSISPGQGQATRPTNLRSFEGHSSDTVAVRGPSAVGNAPAPPRNRGWMLAALGCGVMGGLLTFAATRPPPPPIQKPVEKPVTRGVGIANQFRGALGEVRSVIGRKFGNPGLARRELLDGMLTLDHDTALREVCGASAAAAEAPLCQAWQRLAAHDVAGVGRALLSAEPKPGAHLLGSPMEHSVRISRVLERLTCELFALPVDSAVAITDQLVAESGTRPIASLFAGLRDLLRGEAKAASAREHFDLCADVVAGKAPHRGTTAPHVLRVLAFALALPPGWESDPKLAAAARVRLEECDAYLSHWGRSDLLPVVAPLSISLAKWKRATPISYSALEALPPAVRAHASPSLLALVARACARIDAAVKVTPPVAPAN